MDPIKIRPKRGPESIIQEDIIKMLTLKQWFVKHTHGNIFQSGFPDLYAIHRMYGTRWIDVKNPKAFSFTGAQLKDWRMFAAHGVGVYILVAATEDEYLKLFKPANLHVYLSLSNMGSF